MLPALGLHSLGAEGLGFVLPGCSSLVVALREIFVAGLITVVTSGVASFRVALSGDCKSLVCLFRLSSHWLLLSKSTLRCYVVTKVVNTRFASPEVVLSEGSKSWVDPSRLSFTGCCCQRALHGATL